MYLKEHKGKQNSALAVAKEALKSRFTFLGGIVSRGPKAAAKLFSHFTR